MFVATEKLHGLAKALSKTKATLKTIVYWGPGNPDALQVCARRVCAQAAQLGAPPLPPPLQGPLLQPALS